MKRVLIAWTSICCIATTAWGTRVSGEASPPWRGPIAVAWIDSQRVAVLEADARCFAVVDVETGERLASLALPDVPHAMAMDRGPAREDGSRSLFITCGVARGQLLEVVGWESLPPEPRVTRAIAVGHTPSGLALSVDGERIYVCNRFNNDVTVVERASGETSARWPVAREPVAAAVTHDGRWLFVANHLSAERADQFSTAAAVSVVDTTSGTGHEIRLPNGSNSLRDMELSPCGRLALVTHIEANFLAIPFQVTGGWINRNALTVLDVERRQFGVTILLDDYALGAGNPWSARWSPDGRWIVVTHAGTDEISLIDVAPLLEQIGTYVLDPRTSPSGIVLAPSFLEPYRRRIRLPMKGPRGLAVDNERIVVAGYFSDTLSCLSIAANAVSEKSTPVLGRSYGGSVEEYQVEARDHRLIPLGPPPSMTVERRGEMLFNDATLCYEMWQSCASCHPDARADAINWDLLNDGAGNPKNTKSMLLSHRTPPSMSLGVRATAETAVRAGFDNILFSSPPEEDMAAVDAYLRALEPVPSPYLVDGRLSASAERGKRLFEHPRIGCAVCHPAPLFTDMKSHPVERQAHDMGEEFDTPTLVEVWRTAPYWHDGRFTSIPEVLFEGGHGNHRGQLDRLTPEQRADLVEYTLSL